MHVAMPATAKAGAVETKHLQVLRRSEPEAHFDQLRGASEPDDAEVDAPVYAPDERTLEEDRNHAAAIALHFMHYSFARIHKTRRVTPAMAAGVAQQVWSIEEIVNLTDRPR